jgi:molybdopterin converting factor small subunit
MSVEVKIPLILRQFTNRQEAVEVTAANVPECLNNLTAQFPSLRRWLYNKQGEVATHVHIFINGKQASADELLNDGDELLILLAVSGG